VEFLTKSTGLGADHEDRTLQEVYTAVDPGPLLVAVGELMEMTEGDAVSNDMMARVHPMIEMIRSRLTEEDSAPLADIDIAKAMMAHSTDGSSGRNLWSWAMPLLMNAI
jgi:hypothetical protein